MRTLFIVRHAKSSWSDAGLEDHERPLNGRGKRAAAKLGSFMHTRGLLPDLVLASSALRAQQTLSLWRKASNYAGPSETSHELYLAEPGIYVAQLRALHRPDWRSVMCIGHNPGLEQLLTLLSGKHERLPTAALARVEIPIDDWSTLKLDGNAELVGLWRVKELDD